MSDQLPPEALNPRTLQKILERSLETILKELGVENIISCTINVNWDRETSVLIARNTLGERTLLLGSSCENTVKG